MKRKKHDSPRRRTLLSLLAVLVLSLAPLRLQAADFVLLYSNDNHGEIDPCG